MPTEDLSAPAETPPIRSVSVLLRELADEAHQHDITLGVLIERFGPRGFGILLLLFTLPTFLPLPVGAITGPLCALVGLQLLVLRAHPWLPQRLRQRPVHGDRLTHFIEKRGHWLERMERVARPRWPLLSRSRVGLVISGALITLNGLLLSLPIPFTNYPLGVLLLLFCFALLERDGLLTLIAWLCGIASIGGFLLLSGEVVALFHSVSEYF